MPYLFHAVQSLLEDRIINFLLSFSALRIGYDYCAVHMACSNALNKEEGKQNTE